MSTTTPFTPALNGTISASNKSASVNLNGTGTTVLVQNLGTAEVFVALGSSTVTAVAGGSSTKDSDGSLSVPSGTSRFLTSAPTDTYVAAITASGTATVRASRGDGGT